MIFQVELMLFECSLNLLLKYVFLEILSDYIYFYISYNFLKFRGVGLVRNFLYDLFTFLEDL